VSGEAVALPDIAFQSERNLDGGTDTVWSVAFARRLDDSLVLASGSSDNTVRIWDVESGTWERTLAGHTDTVYSVAWAERSDGKLLLASASRDETARIWDDAIGTCLHTLHGHSYHGRSYLVGSVAWVTEPGGRLLLATGGGDHTARIWAGDTGAHLRSIAHQGVVRSVRWHVEPDGQVLLATGGGGIARVCTRDGEVLRELRGDDRDSLITAVRFAVAADGQLLLATAADGGMVRIWDARTGRRLRALDGHTRRVRSAAWASLADGQLLLATAGWDRTVRIWDPESGTCLHVLGHPDYVHGVAFVTRADGRLLLATAGNDGLVRLWVTTTAVATSLEPRARRRAASAGPWTVDGIVDRTPAPVSAADQPSYSVAWGERPDGHPMLASSGKGWVRVWDADTGAVLGSLELPGVTARELAWANPAGGPRLAIACYDNTARVWELGAAESLVLAGHTEYVQAVAWSRGMAGGYLATGSVDGTARIWDTDTGRSLNVIDTGQSVSALTWEPEPTEWPTLVIGRYGSGRVAIWDTRTGAEIGVLTGYEPPVVHAAQHVLLPGGRTLLATGGSDHFVRIWDRATSACLHRLETSNSAMSVSWAVLPDQRVLLAAGTYNGRVFLWDGSSGALLYRSKPTGNELRSVALCQPGDGRLLLATADRAGVRVFEVLLTPPPGQAGESQEPEEPVEGRMREHAAGFVSLGGAGMWLPFGLLADLVTLTGPAGMAAPLCDPRLRALATDPGVLTLGGLGWPAPARVALAALLAAPLTFDPCFVPPPGSGPAGQHAAIIEALRSLAAPPAAVVVDHDALWAAAAQVSPRTVTLLEIIGPEAVALDPLLPLRLIRYASGLPELTPAQHTLLTASGVPPPRPRSNAASPARVPGSVGITRAGQLPSVLLTEYALPREVFTVRYAANQLLHRHHPATATPPARPITLILDTTPPTYGGPEALLRLTAHLITQTLWTSGQHPLLITLSHPGAAQELTGPNHLLTVWTSRTLYPPDLATALHTATTTATHPTLTLTTHHGGALHPGATADHQLLTTHHAGHPPRHLPANPHHHHLPPSPSPAQLTATITAILSTAGWTG
jgi:WD40 repeat protein